MADLNKVFRDPIYSLISFDNNLYTHFNNWAINSRDRILKSLYESIIYRQPYKMFKEVENNELFDRKGYKKLSEIFKNNPADENYFYFDDQYLNVAYKDNYLLGKKEAERAEHIWLKYADGTLKEFSEVSPIINSLKNNELRKKRAYIHRDYLEIKTKKGL